MAEKYNLNVVYGDDTQGLAKDGRITYGSNSGHQAVHLAYNFGASRIVLLGYDFQGSHWFGDHPEPLRSGHNFPEWIRQMTILAQALARAGVEVINCSRQTALKCFPRKELADVNFN